MPMHPKVPTVRIPSPQDRFWTGMAFRPCDDSMALLDSGSATIFMVDCETGKPLRTFSVGADVQGMSFDELGCHLVAVSTEQVFIWPLDDEPSARRVFPNRVNYDLDSSFPAFSVNGHRAWMFFEDEWQLWSLTEGRIVDTMTAPKGERLLRVTQGPDGVAVTYDERAANHEAITIAVWSLAAKACIREIRLAKWENVVVSYDATTAVIGEAGTSKQIGIWNLRQGIQLRELDGPFVLPDSDFCGGNSRFASYTLDNESAKWASIAITDIHTAEQRYFDTALPIRPFFRCSPYTPHISMIANDRRCPVNTTQFWNIFSAMQIGETQGHVGLSGHFLYSPNGNWFATTNNVDSAEIMVDDGMNGFVAITDLRKLGDR